MAKKKKAVGKAVVGKALPVAHEHAAKLAGKGAKSEKLATVPHKGKVAGKHPGAAKSEKIVEKQKMGPKKKKLGHKK